jgi:hypothetical protein
VALTSRTPFAIAGITHLGYPVYFAGLLAIFKIIGCVAIIIPQVPGRIKEWAYAGFGIDFISALVSIIAVDGFGVGALLPIVFIGILIVSYTTYHKLHPATISPL